MRRLIIINKAQFGYHTDTLKYCEYLNKEYSIQYICFDANKPKVTVEGCNIFYIKHKGTKLYKFFTFLYYTAKQAYKHREAYIFINYFPGCVLYKILLPKKRLILDIRTGSISKQPVKRKTQNLILKFHAKNFHHVTIISENLAKYLRLKKYHIFPVGADSKYYNVKNFRRLHLMYLGTLKNRDIHKTLQGIGLAIKEQNIELTYDIIGEGEQNDINLIKNTIAEFNLEEIITLHGFKMHSEIQDLWKKCNIGVSFIPITEYYDFQPPTKTLEYLMGGMYCIATDTCENAKTITSLNGILIKDTAEDFKNAIISASKAIKTTSEDILKSVNNNTWEAVVLNLKNYLNSLN